MTHADITMIKRGAGLRISASAQTRQEKPMQKCDAPTALVILAGVHAMAESSKKLIDDARARGRSNTFVEALTKAHNADLHAVSNASRLFVEAYFRENASFSGADGEIFWRTPLD